MKRLWIFCVIMCMVAVHGAGAEESLTLERAIAFALDKNVELNQMKTLVNAASVQVTREKADGKPDLTLGANAMARYNVSTDQRPIWLSDDKDSRFFNLSLKSTMNLYNGSLDKYSRERAETELSAANKEYSRVRQTVIFETISRFINVILYRQLIEVEERNLELNTRQLKKITSFYRAGNRPLNDLYQQQAQTSQAELRVLSARHDFEVSKLLLSQIMGNVGDTNYEIAPPDPPFFEKAENPPVADEIFSYAMINRLDVSAQEKSIMAARKKIDEAKAGSKPSIIFSVEAGTNYNTLFWDSNFSDQVAEENPYAAVGISMTLPVFDRKRAHTDLSRAMIDLNSEKLKLTELEQQVDLEVRKAVIDYNTTLLQLDVAGKQYKFASRAFEASKERYDIGTSDLVSLTESMDRLAEASYEKVKARYDHLLANLGLAYYSGDLETRLEKWQKSTGNP